MIAELLGLSEIPRIDPRRPSVAEIVLVLISRDAFVLSNSFKTHPEDDEGWNQLIKGKFMDGVVDEFECSNIMKEAFNVLALAG